MGQGRPSRGEIEIEMFRARGLSLTVEVAYVPALWSESKDQQTKRKTGDIFICDVLRKTHFCQQQQTNMTQYICFYNSCMVNLPYRSIYE